MTCIACYLAGALTFGLLMMVVLMRTHKTPPPTLHHRRKNRDAAVPPTAPSWEREEGVRYEFLGITGYEE